ncbi:MAG: CRISPR-associated helicase Cas3' [Lentimicrobium sp.]|jgi:CRISPR-associated endonuclease/helicase Cas3|nr:CRISPR-associated helicase Cas3' [Lentimicrobium sp.]
MRTFNCFKAYNKSLLHIFNETHSTYSAHLSNDREVKESLFEHSELVSRYCLNLIEAHGIEKLIDSQIEVLMDLFPVKHKLEFGNQIKEAFIAAIVFHDLGKINPNFQSLKMENDIFEHNKKLSIQSNHSLLGSYVYSNLFFKDISENNIFDDDEKLLLYFLILLFATPIIKHHNPKINFTLQFDITQIDECYSFLEKYRIVLEKEFCSSFYLGADDIFNEFEDLVNSTEAYFNLFVLTKLLYSLLTASDFYATNHFMNNTEINEFGILSNEQKGTLINNFRTIHSYNKNLYSNIEQYHSIPFSQIVKQNYENLNILRQKLTAEMVANLRENAEKRCFYLEAPTGSGKTNLSLAFATELLNIDNSLNKIFYIFPFTTLITQTFKSIKETLDIDNNSIVQLHSKAGFHEKEDGAYGNEKRLFIDNLFVNYPITLLSHVRFFDIIKGNDKESNYLMHRLCNSVIVIDEIQTYNPEHWDKIVYFLANYADLFNMRILIMSATLPKIDALHDELRGTFASLITNRDQYFSNPNFAGRVSFDFTLLDKEKPNNEEKKKYLSELSDFMIEKSDQYANSHKGSVKILIEFITKKTASLFFYTINEDERFKNHEIVLLSGDILEFRRRQIINSIKEGEYQQLIVVSTQVVEAGVDIDMDMGFKDRSLIDSDEQLAGRINRNSSKSNCVVYLFDCDKTNIIYGSDFRYKVQQSDRKIFDEYKEILEKKQFHTLYEKVFEEKRKKMGSNLFAAGHYYQYFKDFNFSKLNDEFKLIEDNGSQQLFIPMNIPVCFFENISILRKMDVLTVDKKSVDGVKVFEFYEKLIHCEFGDFILKQIELKKIGSIISQFCISLYKKQLDAISTFLDPEKEKSGFKYLSNWNLCYTPEQGFNSEKIDTSIFI